MREDFYPIKTYKFFEIKPEEIDPEKKLDPFSSLMEAMVKLKQGEQFWFQFVFVPITNSDIPWYDKAKEKVEELVKRPKKGKSKTIAGETVRTLFTEHVPFEQEKKEEPIIPPEMRLTPGERDIVQGIEEKMAQQGFNSYIRGLYIYERDAYVPAHSKLSRAYFSHFSTQNLNTIMFLGKTRTKIHYLFRKRRLRARKQSLLKKYINRFPPSYPARQGVGNMILTAEELATLFHFPMKAMELPPGVPRIPAKKGGPPPGIPGE